MSRTDAMAPPMHDVTGQGPSTEISKASLGGSRRTDLAATLALGALGTIILAFVIGWLWAKTIGLGPSPASLIKYVPEVAHAIGAYPLPDIRIQKWAYNAGLLAVFLPFFLIVLGSHSVRAALLRCLKWPAGHVHRMSRMPVLFWGGLLLIGLVEVRRPEGPLIQPMGLWPLLLALALVLSVGRVALAVRRKAWTSNASRAVAIFLGILIFFVAISGLLFTPDISYWGVVMNTMVQGHFMFVVGAADRLGAGLQLFEDIRPYYGLLPEAMVGTTIRFAGPWEWVSLFRWIQACQVAMLACLLLAMLAWHGTKRPLLWLVLPAALVLPDVFTGYYMNWFPNQTGWRFFGFGLALLALGLTRRIRPHAALPLFGITASIALAWNPETGLIVIFGFLAYLGTGPKRPALLPGVIAACQLAFVTITCLLLLAAGYRLGLGHWPLPPSVASLLAWYKTFLSGWGSLQMVDVDLVAPLIFVHCAMILLNGALTWFRRPISQDLRLRIALATMILGWLSYYVNRPQTLNLWTIVYLYAPLVARAFDPRLLAVNWRRWWPRPTPALLAPVLVVALAFNHGDTLPALRRMLTVPDPSTSVAISGVMVQPTVAHWIIGQADYVQQLPDREHVVTLSANAFLLSLLTGLYPHLPARDPFWECIQESDLKEYLDRLLELAPSRILFDADDATSKAAWGGSDRQKFYARIKSALAGRYVRGQITSGWEVWERVP